MNRDKRPTLATMRRTAARLMQTVVVATLFNFSIGLHAEDHGERAIKQRVAPVYPELARRMRVSGVVRISATVAADGNVSATKTVSGNRMLAGAAEDAVHKWKFVAAPEESTVEVNIEFKAPE